MGGAGFSIAPIGSAADLEAAVALIKAYAASLDIDLGYQDFDSELAQMPGKYAPPGGALLLAHDGDGGPIGCVALRPLTAEAAEMKRLYVAPAGRGRGVGEALVVAILAEGGRLGYTEVRLDTLATMQQALALYRRLGFTSIAPYYDTPVAGTVFLGRTL